jgi:ATP-dependent Clp protease protease subunit
MLIELTAQRTGQDPATIARDSERDRTWDAPEAVTYGFCDTIVSDLAEILPLHTPRAGFSGGER